MNDEKLHGNSSLNISLPISNLMSRLKNPCFLVLLFLWQWWWKKGFSGAGCDGAPLLPLLFIIVNIGFNIALLHLLKISSAVVSCLASTFSGMQAVWWNYCMDLDQYTSTVLNDYYVTHSQNFQFPRKY